MSTQGERIRALFAGAKDEVTIIAPFIKFGAFESILSAVPADVSVRCVTRWLPRDVAAGVSDPEIIQLLEVRGNFTLSLVDRLHAKLYVAGDECLAGSSNVTLAGLGEAVDSGNIEVLVSTSITDLGVAETLREISLLEVPATTLMAESIRRLAENLTVDVVVSSDLWFPRSSRARDAFDFYSAPPKGYMKSSDKLLLADVASLNLLPGFSNEEFESHVRAQLEEILLARTILDSGSDMTLTLSESEAHLEEWVSDKFLAGDLWRSFVDWMVVFFPELLTKQKIAEVALRRARELP